MTPAPTSRSPRGNRDTAAHHYTSNPITFGDTIVTATRTQNMPHIVAFSDGGTAAMAAASELLHGPDVVGFSMAAHRSIWNSAVTNWPTFATAGTWELLGIVLSLDLAENYINALMTPVVMDVYCDNVNCVEFSILGTLACDNSGARHLSPLVELVRARIDRLVAAHNVVNVRTPLRGRRSRGIVRCDAALQRLRPATSRVFPDFLVAVDADTEVALNSTIATFALAQRMEQLIMRNF